jgi:hypothetical protein
VRAVRKRFREKVAKCKLHLVAGKLHLVNQRADVQQQIARKFPRALQLVVCQFQ